MPVDDGLVALIPGSPALTNIHPQSYCSSTQKQLSSLSISLLWLDTIYLEEGSGPMPNMDS